MSFPLQTERQREACLEDIHDKQMVAHTFTNDPLRSGVPSSQTFEPRNAPRYRKHPAWRNDQEA